MSLIKTFSFEKSFACVQLSNSAEKNKQRLYIQIVDEYSYQRELAIDFDYQEKKYKVHSYLHSSPCIREIKYVSNNVGELIIGQIIYLCEKYPDMLFNADSARNKGFVRFHTLLIAGATPSVTLLP
jgi:hypothetical protein